MARIGSAGLLLLLLGCAVGPSYGQWNPFYGRCIYQCKLLELKGFLICRRSMAGTFRVCAFAVSFARSLARQVPNFFFAEVGDRTRFPVPEKDERRRRRRLLSALPPLPRAVVRRPSALGGKERRGPTQGRVLWSIESVCTPGRGPRT